MLAEARRFAADIRRRAERDASDIRRDAAEWAAATRREAEDYRDRLLAAIEQHADEVDRDAVDLDGDALDERVAEADDSAPVVIDLRPTAPEPEADRVVAEPAAYAPAADQRDFVASYLAEHRRRRRWRTAAVALVGSVLLGVCATLVVANLPDDSAGDDGVGNGRPVASSALVELPAAVEGRPLAEVIADLEAAGLSFTFSRVHDEDVPTGAVVSMTGASAVTVPRSTVVTLLVSKGPAPRTIPELEPGADADTAVAGLESLGLAVERREVFHDEIPAGRLVSMAPEPGSSVERGTVVTVTVSNGPDVVTVPDVVGRSLADAEAQLAAAGLATGAIHNRHGGAVVDQRPDAGDEVRRGAPVNLRLGE